MSERPINWIPSLFLIGYHLALLIILPWYLIVETATWQMGLVAFALYFLTGTSITAGYHRLYSHRAYKAHWSVEAVLLWFGSVATQGSVLRWGYDHRLHHAHTDHDEDPYAISRGFWHAHMLWIWRKPPPIDPKVIPDLLNNPMVRFQDDYYPYLMVFTNVVTCGAIGWLMGDYAGAFVLAGLLRMFALHHSTWFINSMAHTWGWKPFCQEQSAVDNFLLSLVTFGEGYHNYHHTFANDYRNGIRWYHFDPTKWLIWTLNKVGLAHQLRRTDPLVVKKRLVLERKSLLLEQIEKAWSQGREDLRNKVQELSDRLLEQLTKLNELRKQASEQPMAELKLQIAELQQNLKRDWRDWVALSRNIMACKDSQEAL